VKSQPQPAPAPSAPAGQSSPTEASEATDDRFDELGDSPTSIELDMYAGHVRRVIRRFYAARARSCFERATRNNHSLRGTVVVRFTIGGQGQVEQSQSIHNTTGNEDLGRCLAGQVGSWRLPPPPAGQTLELEMPFSA
jgi:TonB family protein